MGAGCEREGRPCGVGVGGGVGRMKAGVWRWEDKASVSVRGVDDRSPSFDGIRTLGT